MIRVLCLSFLFAAGMATGAEEDEFASSAADGYLGASVCADCHQSEHALWQNSHHDKAMQPATPETVLGYFDNATFSYFGVKTVFYTKSGKYYVRTDGPDGTLADYPVSYTFGVYPLQQYLIEMPDGRLQALSIVWDTRPAAEGGQRWYHLYPDEPILAGDELHWTGPNQNWNFMCADCHSTNLHKDYDLRSNRYNTTWSELDVGCEACHGPGDRHVRAMKKGERDMPFAGFALSLARAEPKDWFANPETGSPTPGKPGLASQPEFEVCAQCHSRRVTQFHGARPQDGLFDHFMPALLDEGLYHVDGQIDGEVFVYGSFVQSAMYHAGVTCSDCHNPHSLELKAPGNAMCGQCHLPTTFDVTEHHGHPQDSAGAQCVNCHMPDKVYMGVDARRDHSFRIPRPDLSASLGTPNACQQCHTDKSSEWAADALKTLHGAPEEDHFATALYAGRYGSPQAESLLTKLILDTSQPSIARATAVTLLPRYFSRQSAPVLQQASRSEDPLIALGAARALSSVPGQLRPMFGIPALYDEHRVISSLAASHLSEAELPKRPPELREMHKRAKADYVESQLNNADRPESLLNLAEHLRSAGKPEKAETYYRRAIEQAPYYTPAYVNLADFLRAVGRDSEGRLVLEEGLEVVREPGPIEHSLGLLLVRDGRLGEALPYLQSAAEADDATDRYIYVYAVALESHGNALEAISVLERGLEQFPGHRDMLSALVKFQKKEE
ncbi:tetratricopeptide repeat protein [Marinobacter sp. CHS3-4]|uniref:tetratricopeptide repeat protein n=1 Tax=Marinobacter sp. CHS3-4 TaxID=3045174 RepID=UPI0024B51C62|nr:tetratricopeptide repeat protein [Marinobacter sp. CHS3-4]MDI9244258.1 cytochrome c3 family protein [Marinobacter sp. CHS3-4]